jgi:hypothetical protein
LNRIAKAFFFQLKTGEEITGGEMPGFSIDGQQRFVSKIHGLWQSDWVYQAKEACGMAIAVDRVIAFRKQ